MRKNANKSLFWLKALLFSCCLGISVVCQAASGKKPQWLSKGETSLNTLRTNDTYYFKIVQNIGPDLQALRNANANALADYIGKRNQITGLSTTTLTNRQVGGSASSSSDFSMMFTNEFSSDAFYATLVDEYWELVSTPYGPDEYHYYALFAVSADGKRQPVFDRFEVTRSYGAAPALFSIIPGVGQLVKGQKLKGSLMLGGAVLGVGGIILCENRRAYYETRILEQPKFAREYSQKSNNWQTGRNIAIGATAALVAWSVIDAAVAPGATRIRVTRKSALAFRPSAIVSPGDAAPAIAMTVSF